MAYSERRIELITLLNERGIAGRQALWILKHYSWDHIIRQIAYYDFELSIPERSALPRWAASPWLLHRIKLGLGAPTGYVVDSGPNRPSGNSHTRSNS